MPPFGRYKMKRSQNGNEAHEYVTIFGSLVDRAHPPDTHLAPHTLKSTAP
jgi:hypothetical protein